MSSVRIAQSFVRSWSRHSPYRFSSARSARWKVGDVVLAPQQRGSEEIVQATIEEDRGSGWYELSVKGGKPVKCRGTQLRPAPVATECISESTESILSQVNQVECFSSESVMSSLDTSTDPKAPPPPTVYDLDAAVQDRKVDPVKNHADNDYLRQVENHMGYNKWVVFTDLHCSPSSLNTTLQVLDFVHELAIEREAGVLFLGDWWHHRGSIRVDCLNAVLNSLQKWQVPMVMIPGNHDQITLGGADHGLTALTNAYRVVEKSTSDDKRRSFPGPLIFSYPTKFLNALFVPHVRVNAIMESILQSSQAFSAEALFVHADVTGGYMNDMLPSAGGVSVSMFPPSKPIYSGHFHLPHVVDSKSKDISIEYLGSPYQTTLSEAGQAKHIVVLDSNQGWQCVERIPIEFGCKHFRLTGVDDFLKVTLGARISSSASAVVTKGDRVVVSLSAKDKAKTIPGSDFDAHMSFLREAGVIVETREIEDKAHGESTPNKSSEWEELSPHALWSAYIEEEVGRGHIPEGESAEILAKGSEIVDSTLASFSDVVGTNGDSHTLHFESLSIKGFGPFYEKVTYPLANRGMVLVRGTNSDPGSDSNGTGKTSLTIALLWALTGTKDRRPMQDGTVADVVNDFSKAARVSIEGSINGCGFVVTRTKSKSKGALTFIVDDEDVSAQSVKETQEVINEKLGIKPEILSRTLFHGQHAINGLLEASDTKFKEELALVVPVKVWQEAAASARKQTKGALENATRLDGMSQLRQNDLHRAAAQQKKLQELLDDMLLKSESRRKAASLKSLGDLEVELRDVEDRISGLTRERDALMSSNLPALNAAQDAADEAKRLYDESRLEERLCRESVDRWNTELQTAHHRLSKLAEQTSANKMSVCPTCKQPVLDESSQESMLAAMKEQLLTAEKVEEEARSSLQAFSLELDETSAATKQLESIFRLKYTELKSNRHLFDSKIKDLSTSLDAAHHAQKVTAAEIAGGHNETEDKIRRTKEALEIERANFEAVKESYEDLINQQQVAQAESRILAETAKGFSPKGIQTYVLRSAVRSLQSFTQQYLTRLSDGTLRLMFSLDYGDGVSKRVFVQGRGGDFVERPLSALSGGQWRRCSLALTLGFMELIATRGHFDTSLCILDEPLTHLDHAGRAAVGNVLKDLTKTPYSSGTPGLSFSTILMILQDLAAEEIEESFDSVDEVCKRGSKSSVIVDE